MIYTRAVLHEKESKTNQRNLLITESAETLQKNVCQTKGSRLTRVGDGGHVDDPRRSGGLHLVQQEQREEEVAQVVGPELHFEAVLRLPARAHHHAWREESHV